MTNNNNNNNNNNDDGNGRAFTILGTIVALGIPAAWYRYAAYADRRRLRQQREDRTRQQQRRHLLQYRGHPGGSQIKPPFPQIIREMLSKCRLAYLSTVDTEHETSHLSLMRFTYLNDPDDGEVVVMSTNRDTKKFDMLQRQHGVALLVHDFGRPDEDGGVYSITLNGNCRIVDDADRVELYRTAHLRNNPEYPQFIVGDNIAILAVDVTEARICDIHDHVTKWEAGKAFDPK